MSARLVHQHPGGLAHAVSRPVLARLASLAGPASLACGPGRCAGPLGPLTRPIRGRARPGARRETLESYLKRLEGLETIARSFQGVDKCYAIQAGRELRVMVKPERVDDVTAHRLAKEMAERIQSEMEYPGQIRVTVIRETRAIEYAQ